MSDVCGGENEDVAAVAEEIELSEQSIHHTQRIRRLTVVQRCTTRRYQRFNLILENNKNKGKKEMKG